MNTQKQTSDGESRIIKAAQRGDLDAFNLIALRHQNFLFGIALHMLGDEDSASDAVQEALLSAFRKINTFRGDSLRSWLARVVVNACYDEMRRKHRQPTQPLEQTNRDGEEIESFSWIIDPGARPEEQYESIELHDAIQKCLDKLVPAYRVILVLVDVEGLPYEEAARIAGIPVGTVKSRLARARMQLRGSLQNFGELIPAPYRMESFAAAL